MSDNDDSDNAHELLQRLIVSKINSASQTPSDSSAHGTQQSQRTKQIQGKSWKCSGLLIIETSGGKRVQTVQTSGKPKLTPKVTFPDWSRKVGIVKSTLISAWRLKGFAKLFRYHLYFGVWIWRYLVYICLNLVCIGKYLVCKWFVHRANQLSKAVILSVNRDGLNVCDVCDALK